MCGYHANGYGGDSSSGKTTTGIQAAVTFLNAGRDFVEETGNVTEDIRWILEGRDYTRLCLESLNDY